MAIELVTWRDAHSYMDEPDDIPDDFIAETIGWTSWHNEQFLRIDSETTPNGPRCVTFVPREMIVQREILLREDT